MKLFRFYYLLKRNQFYSKWLDNSGYLITQWHFFKEKTIKWFKKLVRTKKVIMVEKISERYKILTVEEKLTALIVNNTKRSLETAL